MVDTAGRRYVKKRCLLCGMILDPRAIQRHLRQMHLRFGAFPMGKYRKYYEDVRKDGEKVK